MEAENMVHSDSMSPSSLGICEKLFRRWELKTSLTEGSCQPDVPNRPSQYVWVCQVQGLGRRGPLPRLLPKPHCTGPSWTFLQVVSLLEGGPTSPFRAEPGRVPWAKTQVFPPGARLRAPTPGLAPGWGPGNANPGDCIESILTGCITAWYGSCTALNRKALQRVVKDCSAHHQDIAMEDLYTLLCQKKVNMIIKDSSHPRHKLCCVLLSGRQFCSIWARTTRLRDSFILKSKRLFYSVDSTITFPS
ncbi:hypothetical protein L3Q82_013735 [Scortum barcoo]|uniref:Uncharacterized protein n=1 Tax=Scortum barcoo TaxID=214431 RepID=A0ACB8W149_9TELE|nr:hypothetical protein L3Q82_013735 [Scortum barcoo]